jgi:hypothetical protein
MYVGGGGVGGAIREGGHHTFEGFWVSVTCYTDNNNIKMIMLSGDTWDSEFSGTG